MTIDTTAKDAPTSDAVLSLDRLATQLIQALDDTSAEWGCIVSREGLAVGEALLAVDRRGPSKTPAAAPLSQTADGLLITAFAHTHPLFTNRVNHGGLAGLPSSCPTIRSFALLPTTHDGTALVFVLVNADTAFASPTLNRLHAQLGLRDPLQAPTPVCELIADFSVHFQAQWKLTSGALFGLEALPRWRGKGGTVSIGTGLQALNAASAINAWTDRLLLESLQHWAAWQQARLIPRGVTLAINLNREQLIAPDLPERLRHGLRQHNVDASQLVLEIEWSVWRDRSAVGPLNTLHRLGVKLAVDRFDSDETGLAELAGLPMDLIKISPQLVKRLGSSDRAAADDAARVARISEFARSLVLPTVAVGVEGLKVRDSLTAAGYQAAQGYAMAPPLPAAEIPGLLRQLDVDGALSPDNFVDLAAEHTDAQAPSLGHLLVYPA